MSIDYISRQAAIDALIAQANSDEAYGYVDGYTIGLTLATLPSADVQPVRRGRWIDKDGGIATCSECGERWGVWSVMNYCPSCGARMDGE